MSEELSVTCFEIITYVGTARSCFINAIQCAKKGEFEQAEIGRASCRERV